jgi:hypothetical protein
MKLDPIAYNLLYLKAKKILGGILFFKLGVDKSVFDCTIYSYLQGM